MQEYIGRRLLMAVPVLWLAATLAFLAMHFLPGNPAEVLLSQSGGSAEAISDLQAQLGLDAPIHIQYLRFLGNVLRGNLGRSLITNRPVTITILEQLPHTIALTLTSMVIAVLLGTALGIAAALNQHTWLDSLCVTISTLGTSVPIFWSSLVLLFLFSLLLPWLPLAVRTPLQRSLLPAVVLGFASAGSIARLTRSSMLEILNQDYILVARAKGLGEYQLLWRHALRNLLIPLFTMIGLQCGHLLGGAVVTETIFARQGLGRLVVDAILWKDFPLVQGAVLWSALIFVLLNLIVDVAYAFADPRIRYD